MLFNSYHFFAFFLVVLTLLHLFKHNRNNQKFIFLAASYYFYGQFSIKYLFLILITTVVDFHAGQRIYRKYHPVLMLALSLTINLGILCLFKYLNFLVSIINSGFSVFNRPFVLGSVDILLPAGISFYTFQSLSYTVDIYRSEIKPRERFLDYALFVSFFPQLVAGPIVRAKEFFSELDAKRKVGFESAQVAVSQITLGFIKKLVVADNLALFVNPIFESPVDASAWETLLAIYAFAFQIYFDFSGYTDIAIGTARLLGFRFPQNFDHPYIATTFSAFWRRWHITLSRWMRDYLYFSFGGSRFGFYMTIRNLMLTMLLGGLWHGAGWTFVIWGGIHGGYLTLEHLLRRYASSVINSTNTTVVAVRWLVTFQLVCFAWIFFRAESYDDCIRIITNLSALGVTQFPPELTSMGVAILALMGLQFLLHKFKLLNYLAKASTGPFVTLQTIMLLILICFVPEATEPFIYFQF